MPLAPLVALIGLACACDRPASPPPGPSIESTRPLGTWEGRGNKLVGPFISDSGRFRVRWSAQDAPRPGAGRFRLSFRSATSGRVIETVVDHRGEGGGTRDFVDDPRIYDVSIDASDVRWSVTVEELFVGRPPSAPHHR
jgi:hypothetical protein